MPRLSEYDGLFGCLKQLLQQDDSRNMIIIAVGGEDCVEALVRSQQKLYKKAFHKRLKFWQGTDDVKTPVYFTTSDELPECLSEAETLCETRKKKKRRMVVVAGRTIKELDLSVGEMVQTLAVVRPADLHSSPKSLMLHESSSFCDVPLKEWNNRRPQGHDLITGPGVQLQVNPSTSPLVQQPSLDDKTLGLLRRHVEKMEKMTEGGTDPQGWQRWKRPVAAIMGILSGAGIVVSQVKVSVGGYAFALGNLSLSTWGVSLNATLIAAGCGFATGALVAVFVYYVPWDTFFTWVGKVLSTVWELFCEFWSKLFNAVKSFTDTEHKSRRRRGRRSCSRSRSSSSS